MLSTICLYVALTATLVLFSSFIFYMDPEPVSV